MPKGRNVAEFREWLRLERHKIDHTTRRITLYKVRNTLIRRITLHNGEIIETYIPDEYPQHEVWEIT